MGFKRQRVNFGLFDARETDATDPNTDLSHNYELQHASFAAISDDGQQLEEDEPLPEPEEPFLANLDPFNLFAYFFRV